MKHRERTARCHRRDHARSAPPCLALRQREAELGTPFEAIARLRVLLKRFDLRTKYGKAFTLTDCQGRSKTGPLAPVEEPAKEEEQQPKKERWLIVVRGGEIVTVTRLK